MQERTTFRLAMLKNGYWPVLTDCKQPVETGWPKRRPDEAEIISWDRSALLSTGMKLDGDLAVIDADVRDAALVDALARALDDKFPELFARGLVRHAGGPKEAWIARVDAPFKYVASRRWYAAGCDPDDPAVPKHQVECFGSLGTRHFGIDGPHSRNRQGQVISTYHFAGDASPATTPRSALPGLPKAAFAAACDRFDEIAAEAGLTCVKGCRNSRGETTPRGFELEAGTEIDTREHGAMTVAEIERLWCKQRASGGPLPTLRCSGSFHDSTRTRTDSHLINWGRYGLGIWDAMTGTTWHRRERKPPDSFPELVDLQAKLPDIFAAAATPPTSNAEFASLMLNKTRQEGSP